MQTGLLILRQIQHGPRHQEVGRAVPIGAGIVVQIVGGPPGVSLVPLLHDRHADHHGLRHPGIVHGFEELVHPGRLLDEVEEMQVAIDHLVLRRRRRFLGGCRGDRQQQERGETGESSSWVHRCILHWFASGCKSLCCGV